MAEEVALRPGAVVVLEGLDATGKSTQIEKLKALPWASDGPAFAHMPSGLTELTTEIYRLTETHVISSPLARQLLHLACHAENMDRLVDARTSRGLVLDRWWWSTIAYGWFGANLEGLGIERSVFEGIVRGVWSRIHADVVLLFNTPHLHDDLNTKDVARGYKKLAEDHAERTVVVPTGTPDEVHKSIYESLVDRGILVPPE